MNIDSQLIAELRDKAYRDAYIASQIRIGLPFQARALRQARGWTQGDLAARAGMAQPRIAEIEKPGKRSLNLDTLLRLASAFDVGLEVRFVPISEIVEHSEAFQPDTFNVSSFADELTAVEREREAQRLRKHVGAALDKLVARTERKLFVVPPKPKQLPFDFVDLTGGSQVGGRAPTTPALRRIANAPQPLGTFVAPVKPNPEHYGTQRQTA